MATSILDLMGHVQNQFEAGRQERKQKQIGSLAAMAYGAKPQERAGYMQQLVELDPEAATRLQGVLDTGDDRKRQALGRAATLILEAPDEMRASLWPQIVSDLEAQGITGMKPQWSPEALPMAQRIAQAFGGGGAGDELKSLRIGANGNYWAIRGGQFVDTGVPAAPDVQIIDAGAAGHYGVNKRTLGATPVRVGAGTAAPAQSLPPQAGEPTAMSPDVVTAAANRMAKAGVPPEEIDAWVVQATGGAWSDAQPQAAPASAGPILRKVPQISPAEQQRIEMERERLNRPPSGYRWGAAGQLEPIPGGPADPNAPKPIPPAQRAKIEQMRQKESRLVQTTVAGMDDTIRLIDDILKRRGDFGGVTGLGAIGAKIPGTDWADLEAMLETLRARSAFNTLQEMRANSPTGGALGSVTERELALLQNAETQLSKAQSPEALERALADYKRKLLDAKRRLTEGVREFYEEQLPQGATTPQQGGRRLRFNPATGRIE